MALSRTVVFLFAVFLRVSSFASPLREHKLRPKAVWELASKLGIPKGADLVAETQARWLRKPGQERWDLTQLSPDQRLFILTWAKQQYFFTDCKPVSKIYDKALIGGAITSTMQRRLDYLKRLWDEGVRFHEVVWLTGNRPLNPKADGLIDRCTCESEAAHLIWKETPLPEAMRNIPVVFVAAPMKPEGRPNRKDTILAWLKTETSPSTLLIVSDQPFCGYEFAVFKSILPDAFLFDVVGPFMDPTSRPAMDAVILDSVARWLYEESL